MKTTANSAQMLPSQRLDTPRGLSTLTAAPNSIDQMSQKERKSEKRCSARRHAQSATTTACGRTTAGAHTRANTHSPIHNTLHNQDRRTSKIYCVMAEKDHRVLSQRSHATKCYGDGTILRCDADKRDADRAMLQCDAKKYRCIAI